MNNNNWEDVLQQLEAHPVDLKGLDEEAIGQILDRTSLPDDKVARLLEDLKSALDRSEFNRRRLARVLAILSNVGEYGLKLVKLVS
jgi:hypothetical protein